MPNREVEQVRVLENAFSGNIDHTVMTGGRFDRRKLVEILSDRPRLHINQVMLPIDNDSYELIHQGMHTLEHYMAYSGGVRVALKTTTGDQNIGPKVLDVSPYLAADGQLGFRMVSTMHMTPSLLERVFTETLKSSERALLTPGSKVPFATPEECGQFQFHDQVTALNIAHRSIGQLQVAEEQALDLNGQFVSVADFRLLKPQLPDTSSQTFLTPENSYYLAQLLEEKWSETAQSLGHDGQQTALMGVYGCMTGYYPMTVSENNPQTFNDAERQHAVATRILTSVEDMGLDPQSQKELNLALDLIAQYSPQVYAQARL